jgi:hypothetical protein
MIMLVALPAVSFSGRPGISGDIATTAVTLGRWNPLGQSQLVVLEY